MAPAEGDRDYRQLFDLTGKVAVVTGAARGLGRELCRGLAACGARIVAGDRNLAGAHTTAAEITAAGGEALAARVDVADGASCEALVAACVAKFGRLDVLVNNAAIDAIEPALEASPENWARVLEVNLTGAFRCAQLAAARMVEQGGGGSIVNISSVAGAIAVRNLVAYGAAKGGLNQATRVLALELAPHGVRVNAVAPGYLENVMAGAEIEHADPAKERYIATRTPLGRRARLSELVGPVVFLASDAASYVTGAVLYADGGFSAA
ncbi:MAG TPA: glucose 1-dehydrogenase [Polyangiaceae bacterium]|nr:glucose 1-dehydrogenase [Polyangiaceae bacterium]